MRWKMKMKFMTWSVSMWILGWGSCQWYAWWKKRLPESHAILKEEIESNVEKDMAEEVIREQLVRNYSFLGEEKMIQVRRSFIIVVGLGGVGSHAVHMLIRSGVEHVRIIDFDQVTLSSLNRHAVAKRADVGRSKVEVMKQHCLEFAPHVLIEERNELFREENAERLLEGHPDMVLDCIDNLTTKVCLLKYCYENNIKVISSMGASAKKDPTRIQIADIYHTKEDPLCRAIRRGLKREGITKGIPVIYSTEISSVALLPLDKCQIEETEEYRTFDNFRIRILPVLGPLPAMFGSAMAIHVINTLTEDSYLRPITQKNRFELYGKLIQRLRNREKDIFKTNVRTIKFEENEIEYLVEEVWQGRSAKSNALVQLALTRWRREKPSSMDNLILLTETEARYHDSLYSVEESSYSPNFIQFVETRLAEYYHIRMHPTNGR